MHRSIHDPPRPLTTYPVRTTTSPRHSPRPRATLPICDDRRQDHSIRAAIALRHREDPRGPAIPKEPKSTAIMVSLR